MARISDLILDSKLETHFLPDCTVHTFQESDPNSRQRLVIRSEHWRRQRKIGGGGFGTVWLETCTQGSRGTTQNAPVRAVKQIDLDPRLGKLDYNRELEAIAKFSHTRYERCFVKSFGWYESSSQLFIAMEYLEIGDLSTYLRENPPLPENEAKYIAYQVLDGLNMMHRNGFAHRDLKPNNILIESHPPHDWWIKLADFGITKRVEEGRGQTTTITGTPRYFAPEIWGFSKRENAYASDIWALGEIIFEVLTKKPAFGNPASIAGYKSDEQFPIKSLTEANVSQSGIHFIISLMHPDPKDRRTTASALSDKWIQSLVPHSFESAKQNQRESQFSPSVADLTEEFASWNTRYSSDDTVTVRYGNSPSIARNLIETTENPVIVAEKTQTSVSLGTTPLETAPSQAEINELSPEELREQRRVINSLCVDKRLVEAETMLRRIYQIHSIWQHQDATQLLSSGYWLTSLFLNRKQFKEAETLSRDVLQGYERVLGPDHEETLYCVDLLGQSLYQQERYSEAEAITRRALCSREKTLGPGHRATMESLYALGQSLYGQHRYKEAETAYRQSLQGYKQLRGPIRPNVVAAAYGLGLTLYDQERYGEAETTFREALEGQEHLLGKSHKDTLQSMTRLGLCLFEQGNYKESEIMFRKALQEYRIVLGPTHKDTLASAHMLGRSLQNQDRVDDAVKEFCRICDEQGEPLSVNDESTLDTVYWLAMSLHCLARYTEAEPLLRRALHGREKTRGPDDDGTIECAYWLGHTLYVQNRYKEATDAYYRARRGLLETMIGPSHGIALEATFYLGKCHYELHEYKEAENMFLQALQGQEQIFGENHDKARLTRECLEKTHQKATAQSLQKPLPDIAEGLEKARQKALARSRRRPLPAMDVETFPRLRDQDDTTHYWIS
ncbi:Tetratricopeptide-like helical [Penicillium subrubescens]|uniref:Spindle assembly checkpoint kinase n=1 Tax=Penicillium subrubescens TaxID=1316194 RepID=A0A1Q5TIB4_9EURO|nr:Tetratricopeptide-like helical [Penicillium subrubescens]KAJ5906473.1 Tetratricopeptide-like helical [Penicillium subrubescens]OKO99960.1 Spindle assembly checkpoint kinase [Penicillium subrubescens]